MDCLSTIGDFVHMIRATFYSLYSEINTYQSSTRVVADGFRHIYNGKLFKSGNVQYFNRLLLRFKFILHLM